MNQNAPEILAKRGYSTATVEAARRFYNGQLTPGEFLRMSMKFMSACFYRNSLLEMAHEVFSPGPRPKMRPEPLIFGYSQLLRGWTVMDRLSEIEVPRLVMAGRYDFLFPPEHQAILADRLSNAKLVLIERAGHNPQMERTAEVIQAVRDFMATANVPESRPTAR